MGEESRLAAVVALAQGMAAAHSSRESWRAAAGGACRALGGSFAALSVWERELGRLRVLVNAEVLSNGIPLFAGPDDERAILEGPEQGWGPLLELGVGLIQTDWPWLLSRHRDAASR